MSIEKILNKRIKISYITIFISSLFIVSGILDLINTTSISFLFDIIIIYIAFKFLRNEIKVVLFVKRKQYNADEINAELTNILVETKEGHVFTENYAILLGEFIEICNYSDILLMYKKSSLAKQLGPRESLFLVTKNGNEFEIILWSLHSEKNNKNTNFEELLRLKNPNILLGRTKENRELLKEKYSVKI